MKTVELPDEVVALYAERAARSGRSLVDEVVAKLLEANSVERLSEFAPVLPHTGGPLRRAMTREEIDAMLFDNVFPSLSEPAPTLAGNGGRPYEVTREEIDAMIFDDVNPEYRPPA